MNQQNYGNCQRCGAVNNWSQKANKPYCSAKCWLNNQPQQNQGYQQPSQPQGGYQQPVTGTGTNVTKKEPDWDQINAEKSRDIHWQVCFKAACAGYGVMQEILSTESLSVIHNNAGLLFKRLHVLTPWAPKAGNMAPPEPPPMPQEPTFDSGVPF